MKIFTFFISFLILLTIFQSPAYSQEWSRIYKNLNTGLKNGEDKASAIATDSKGDIYVAGNSSGFNGKSDICIIKYNPSGDSLWTRIYDSTSITEDKAYAITIDELDNIYITGYSTSESCGKDIIIIKYSTLGTLLWSKTYNNSAANKDDIAYTLKLDNANNLYVSGFSTGINSGADYITLKYNAFNGTLIWSKIYNGTGNKTDIVNAITVDSYNNVIVTGNSQGTSSAGFDDIVTIKYNAANGNQLWLNRFNGSEISSTQDKAYAITIDKFDNVYIAGNTSGNNLIAIVIISYNSSGSTNWIDVYTNSNTDYMDSPFNILCTDNNSVLVSGTTKHSSQPGTEDFITIACHSNNGNFKWVNIYNSPYNGTDVVSAMTLSESKKEVYVCGYSSRGEQSSVLDIVTLKYKLANGDLLDSTRFNISGIDKSNPVGIAVDNTGNLYITGWRVSNYLNKPNESVVEDSDILTVKYSMTDYGLNNASADDNNGVKSNNLYQNYPNPFNPVTLIKFKLSKSTHVTLKVYDMLGREIQTLVNNYFEAGEHSVQFDCGDLSSGTYLYELNVNGVKDIKKMILIK